MTDKCTDNRFEIIAEVKKVMFGNTNRDISPEEMAVIDRFLYRCWKMGWYDLWYKLRHCENASIGEENGSKSEKTEDESDTQTCQDAF